MEHWSCLPTEVRLAVEQAKEAVTALAVARSSYNMKVVDEHGNLTIVATTLEAQPSSWKS